MPAAADAGDPLSLQSFVVFIGIQDLKRAKLLWTSWLNQFRLIYIFVPASNEEDWAGFVRDAEETEGSLVVIDKSPLWWGYRSEFQYAAIFAAAAAYVQFSRVPWFVYAEEDTIFNGPALLSFVRDRGMKPGDAVLVGSNTGPFYGGAYLISNQAMRNLHTPVVLRRCVAISTALVANHTLSGTIHDSRGQALFNLDMFFPACVLGGMGRGTLLASKHFQWGLEGGATKLFEHLQRQCLISVHHVRPSGHRTTSEARMLSHQQFPDCTGRFLPADDHATYVHNSLVW
jgi:hypothetical protein